jgi:hypothetical protein
MQFGDNLESFEVTRSTTLASYLRTMVDTMVGIALKLPQEIERVAEVESFELNAVIIGNRRAHAELMARMEKEDIMEKVEAREKWEKRRYDWRQLRHARGIREFHRDITADNFTNPPSRVEVFDAFKKEQEERHQTRCDVLARLGAMDHYTLASDKVSLNRASETSAKKACPSAAETGSLRERKEGGSFCGGNRLAQRAQKELAAAAHLRPASFVLTERAKRAETT